MPLACLRVSNRSKDSYQQVWFVCAILKTLQLNRSPSLCHHEETVPPDGVGFGGVWDREVYDPGQTGNTVKISYEI